MTTRKHLVVAPHPDDELLGCGGTLLKAAAAGEELHWVTVTEMSESAGYSAQQIAQRAEEISTIVDKLGFSTHTSLGYPPAGLTTNDVGELVGRLSGIIRDIEPDTVYLPFYGDVHSDHRICFDAAAAATKFFRNSSIRRVLCYEVLSETDAAITPGAGFAPNLFVDISAHIESKLALLDVYASEMGQFPFPRSAEAVEALARVRGVASGAPAAEAFMILRERESD